MAISVITWVWDHSRSRHAARLVLLAIADSAGSDGDQAWPSIAELTRKAGLGERTVHTAIAELVALGELQVSYNAGPRGCNRYRVIMAPAESAPPRNRHPRRIGTPPRGQRPASPQTSAQDPAESAPSPAKSAPPQNRQSTPAESAPGTVLNRPPPSPHPSTPPKEGEENWPAQDQLTVFVEEIRGIRNDWSSRSIRRVLADPSVRERGWALVRRAMIAVATDAASQQPGRLAFDGPWWHTPQPGRVAAGPDVTCALHFKTYPASAECPGCAADRKAAS